MKKITIIISFLSLVIYTSCEIADFGDSFQENPNLLTPDQADPNFLLNNVQKETADLLQDLNRTSDEVVRYTVLNESYSDVAEPSALNSEYINYYAFLEDAAVIIDLAENDEGLLFHRGMSNILTTYATVTMVDYLGDIPFSEANKGNEGIFNPKPDDDEAIYNTLLDLLDTAIQDINNATLAPLNDLFYNPSGDTSLGTQKTAWVRLAKSLQFKMLVNMGDTARLNTLLAENNFITPAEDFQFQYGTSGSEPNSRHPDFNIGYEPGGSTQYLGNTFLNLLLNDKSVRDPRLRYYIYRQSSTAPSDLLLGNCLTNNAFDFCYLGDGYYGRDHGDNRITGTDNVFRATYGIYPVGGAFDEDNPSAPDFAEDTQNQLGAGILPVLLSSFVDFLRAEAALNLSTNDDAAALLESGIRKSMDKVLNFVNATSESAFAPTSADVDTYVAEVMAAYTAADDQGKLDIVLKEYYLASYGNSTEAYNGYRRTGLPSAFTASISDINTPFPRLFSMPEDAVINNNQINQRPITTQVFWDKLAPGALN